MSAYRRGSIIGPVLLIALGTFFLYANLRPGLDTWPLLSRYWPLFLVFLGLGRLGDHFRQRRDPHSVSRAWLGGGEIAILLLVVILGIALSRGLGRGHAIHYVESVERRGAESVRVHVEMPAGNLRLTGGAHNLLDADFNCNESEGKPKISYDVTGSDGQLLVTQESGAHAFGRSNNNWDLRLSDDVPMELKIEMGAGQSDLRLGGLSLTRLDIEIGAGQVTADLTGNWKKDLDAKIEGGVGSAIIRLPQDVGVRVHATGGMGSVNASGLLRDGEYYVNREYGKSRVTLRLSVEGGVGSIRLVGATPGKPSETMAQSQQADGRTPRRAPPWNTEFLGLAIH